MIVIIIKSYLLLSSLTLVASITSARSSTEPTAPEAIRRCTHSPAGAAERVCVAAESRACEGIGGSSKGVGGSGEGVGGSSKGVVEGAVGAEGIVRLRM